MQPDTRIVVTRALPAPAERVFDAFLDPAVAPLFLFATVTGETIVAAIDARVGGGFTITERRPDTGDVRHVGRYLAIDRPGGLRFEFGVPQFSPGTTTVAIGIRPLGDHCELTLTHDGVLPEFAERTRDGWDRILAGLLPAYDGMRAAGWR